MVFASRPGSYATIAGPLFAALFYIGSASAQTPGMKLISFGGNDQESLAGFAIDHDGNYYIAGTTASLDLPVNVLQKNPGGAYLYRFRAGHADPLHPWPAAVSAIASDPSHPGYLYASFNHAVWRSPDGGDTWQNLDADWPTAADCTGITVAPQDGRSIYVLCPVGSSYSSRQYLFRSTDAGVTWVRARNEQDLWGQQLFNFAPIRNLTADPFNPQSVWAEGLIIGELTWPIGLHSTDGGDTWTETDPTLIQFAFDDRHAGIAYAYGSDRFYYRSTDAGLTWTKLASPSPPAQYFGASIAILPSGDALFQVGNVLERTRDNGLTWQGLPLPSSGTPCQNLYGGQDSALRADSLTGSVYLQMCGNPQSYIFRSDDAGGAWARVNATGLPDLIGQAISSARTSPEYFAIVRKSSDAFVAKLSPSGDMIWATFLGGVHDDTATGLTLDSKNNVYVMGTTLSDDFTFTGAPLAKALSNASVNPKSFIAKFSPDGTQLLYSVLFAYDATARGIAIDSSGAVYITGNAGPSLPTTPGVIRPNAIGSGPNPFVLKLDPSASRVVYGTYLAEDSYTVPSPLVTGLLQTTPILSNAIAVDSDGGSYAGGTYIWKLNPDATSLVFSTKLDGGMVNAMAVDASRSLYVGGAANTLTLPTTPGAFQSSVLPTGCGLALVVGGPATCWANPAFVTKFNVDASLLLYSTYLGGDGWDVVRSLAVVADGTVYTTGHTSSRSFPTRLPIQGSLLPLFGQNGFASALFPDGSDIAMSTYIGDGRALDAIAVALDPAGNPVVAGHNLGAANGTYNVPTQESDILIFHLDYSSIGNLWPRLDSVLNAASRTGTPLAHGQRVALLGAGFQTDSQVCFNDACVSPLIVSDRQIVVAPPASIQTSGPIAVSVQSPAGSRSNQVLMPAGPAQLALYSADNSGTGTVLALNEDGTLNSPANPARRGTIVTNPSQWSRPVCPCRPRPFWRDRKCSCFNRHISGHPRRSPADPCNGRSESPIRYPESVVDGVHNTWPHAGDALRRSCPAGAIKAQRRRRLAQTNDCATGWPMSYLPGFMRLQKVLQYQSEW
jgi:hypothetical protein